MIGLSADDPVAFRFARERIGAVRKVIHAYYLAILMPFIGVAANNGEYAITWICGGVFAAAVVLRFRHWSRPVPTIQSEHANPAAARLSGFMIVLLSTVQAVYYIAIGHAVHQSAPLSEAILPLIIGLLAAFVQAIAVTGVVFASRVVIICQALPIVVASFLEFGGEQILLSLALCTLTVTCWLFSEISHRTHLAQFKAQHDAIAARKEAQFRANHDALTGAQNRNAFLAAVEQRLRAGHDGLLVLFDLDRFKPINDLYGHHAGDEVLRAVAERCERMAPSSSVFGRLGGDEFGIFLEQGGAAGGPERLLEAGRAMMAELERPIALAHTTVSVGASGGARLISCSDDDIDLAFREADAALYSAKLDERGSIKLFDHGVRSVGVRKLAVEKALLQGEALPDLSLVYQPIFDLRSGRIASFEALARWTHPELGVVSPAEFIPIAERSGLINTLSLALLRIALRFSRAWRPDLRLSFNISAVHLCADGAAQDIIRMVEEADFPPERLELEITETAMLVNFEKARANIRILREAGCRVALDDFGAGFASLVYLREIQFDKVKIDGSLIGAARRPQGQAMLRGVIKMVEAMNLDCVAEYIETREDLDIASRLGASHGQGFNLGHPLGDADVMALIAAYDIFDGRRPPIRSLGS